MRYVLFLEHACWHLESEYTHSAWPQTHAGVTLTQSKTPTLTLQSQTWSIFTHSSSVGHTHTLSSRTPSDSQTRRGGSVRVTCWTPSHTPLSLGPANTRSACQVEMPPGQAPLSETLKKRTTSSFWMLLVSSNRKDELGRLPTLSKMTHMTMAWLRLAFTVKRKPLIRLLLSRGDKLWSAVSGVTVRHFVCPTVDPDLLLKKPKGVTTVWDDSRHY